MCKNIIIKFHPLMKILSGSTQIHVAGKADEIL